jgi:prepilin-type processing-associated H-X9-DG protein
MLLPTRPSSLSGNLGALRLSHGLKTALPADLTAFAPYCGHVRRQVRRRSRFGGWYLLRLWRVTCRLLYNPFCKLVWITRTFAFADGHANIMPQAGMLKRDCGYSN